MTTATLRPNATITAADSRTGGAASDHASVNDDSDSTYVTDNDLTEFGLGTTTLGTGTIVKQVRYRWRGRADSGTPTLVVNLDYRSPSDPGTVLEVLAGQNHSPSTTLANFASAYVPGSSLPGPSEGVTWQTLVDNLGLSFSLGDPGGSAVRVYEAYADVVYVVLPVVAVDAVTDPYTASTIVPISWANTLDTDGGAQTRYEIKVYTDAQYGAGGFDPDTSTPYYTSGEVVSSLATANVGPLENTDTYRAYVRVGQTVNGATHWSDWAFDQFTMSVTTSDVDSVAAVATDASGLITVTVAWDSGSAGWAYIEAQRSIDAGTTWTDVRGATFAATADSGATDFEVVDYEVPNGTSVLYRARATYYSSGLPITGSWVQSSSTSWSSSDTWIKDPTDSSLNTKVGQLRYQPETSRPQRRGVFPVIGAAKPVVVSDVRSSPVATLVVRSDSLTDAGTLDDLLDTGRVLLVQTPAVYQFGSKYLACGEASREMISPQTNSQYAWTTISECVEVDAPADAAASDSSEHTS